MSILLCFSRILTSQTNIKGDMERKGMLNFSFINWRSLDVTCEIKHTGWNLMLMENGLLSDVFNAGYTFREYLIQK